MCININVTKNYFNGEKGFLIQIYLQCHFIYINKALISQSVTQIFCPWVTHLLLREILQFCPWVTFTLSTEGISKDRYSVHEKPIYPEFLFHFPSLNKVAPLVYWLIQQDFASKFNFQTLIFLYIKYIPSNTCSLQSLILLVLFWSLFLFVGFEPLFCDNACKIATIIGMGDWVVLWKQRDNF